MRPTALHRDRVNRSVAILGAVLGWAALVLQLVLLVGSIAERGGSLSDGVYRFVGFFTIWGNVAAASVLSAASVRPQSLSRLNTPRVELAVVTAMVVVDATYSLVLRQIYHPQGLDKLADFALHDMLPLVFVLFWLTRPRGTLRLNDIPFCLVMPGTYCLIALLRAGFDGWYPYPFLDAGALGSGRLALNCLLFAALFLALGLIFWVLDKGLARVARR